MPKYRVYRTLVRLYPKTYREKFEADILQTLDDILSATPSKTHRFRIEFEELVTMPGLIVRQYDRESEGKIRILFGAFSLFIYAAFIMGYETLEKHGVYAFANFSSAMPIIGAVAVAGSIIGAIIPLSLRDYQSPRWTHFSAYILSIMQACIVVYIILHCIGMLH